MQCCVMHFTADNIAAFIAEPVMGAGGCVVPPPGYIRKVWEVCQANDIAYISGTVGDRCAEIPEIPTILLFTSKCTLLSHLKSFFAKI